MVKRFFYGHHDGLAPVAAGFRTARASERRRCRRDIETALAVHVRRGGKPHKRLAPYLGVPAHAVSPDGGI
jgi:hypothetical protein